MDRSYSLSFLLSFFLGTKSYTQTIPSRFVKEVLNAADENHDGYIEQSEFVHLLRNIGVQDQLTPGEIDEIMTEVCHDTGDCDGTSTSHKEGKHKVSVEKIQALMIEEVVSRDS